MNARKHWESKSRNRSLSAAVLLVKPSGNNSNLYYSRENHHKSLQYRKRNRDFTINFQNLAFFQGVFHVLERCISFEPWDLFPLTLKCYRKCLQNYKGTIFDVAWTEKYRFEIINAVTDQLKAQSSQLLAWWSPQTNVIRPNDLLFPPGEPATSGEN